MKTVKFISQNDNGVIFISNDAGDIYGIVDYLKIIDEDGIPFESFTFEVLDSEFDLDLIQDFEDETTTILTNCGKQIVFSGSAVSLVDGI